MYYKYRLTSVSTHEALGRCQCQVTLVPTVRRVKLGLLCFLHLCQMSKHWQIVTTHVFFYSLPMQRQFELFQAIRGRRNVCWTAATIIWAILCAMMMPKRVFWLFGTLFPYLSALSTNERVTAASSAHFQRHARPRWKLRANFMGERSLLNYQQL